MKDESTPIDRLRQLTERLAAGVSLARKCCLQSDMDEGLTFDVVAETVGARRSLVVRLARQGLIETVIGDAGEPLVPRSAIMQLRRMQRLHRDLGVNFPGAAIILDLVGRIEQLKREMMGRRPTDDR